MFDIDGTLIRLPSTERRFARELRKHGLLPAANQLRFLIATLRRFPSEGTNVLRRNVAYLHGLAVDEVTQRADLWARVAIEQVLLDAVHQRLLKHRAAGDLVTLLSGTPEFLASALGRALGADHAWGSSVGSQDGRFTGGVFLRHLYGEEKVRRANELCKQFGWRRENLVCYADSWSDRPLLEWAGRACVVNPSQKLAAEAQRRGWDVLPG